MTAAGASPAATLPPPGTAVWLRQDRGWYPGVVLAVASLAATVRYRLPGGGTLIDTVTLDRIAARREFVAELDDQGLDGSVMIAHGPRAAA